MPESSALSGSAVIAEAPFELLAFFHHLPVFLLQIGSTVILAQVVPLSFGGRLVLLFFGNLIAVSLHAF